MGDAASHNCQFNGDNDDKPLDCRAPDCSTSSCGFGG